MNDTNKNPGPSGDELPPDAPRLNTQQTAYVDALFSEGSAADADMSAPPGGQVAEPFASVDQILKAFSKLPEHPAPPDLAARTLEAIRRNRIGPYDFDDASLISGSGSALLRRSRIAWNRRSADVAVMLVAASLLVVVLIFGLTKARQNAVRYACQDNLQNVGAALGQYAVAYAGMLPQITTPRDHNWLPLDLTPNVKRSSDAHSNLADLSPMVNGAASYTSWDRFVCPGDQMPSRIDSTRPEWDNVSYSYLDQLASYHHQFNEAGQIAVLADRNPVFSGQPITSGEINSFNHSGSNGQNVLYDDGSVDWVSSPDVGPDHDNIWTIGNSSHITYTGYEEPQSTDDIILVP